MCGIVVSEATESNEAMCKAVPCVCSSSPSYRLASVGHLLPHQSSIMVITVQEARQWDCTSGDIDGYRRLVQQRQAEAFLTIYAAAWVPADASSSSQQQQQGDQGTRYLVTGLSNGEIRLYSSAQLLRHYQASASGPTQPLARLQAHSGPVYSIAFVPPAGGSGGVLVSGGDDGRVLCWRVSDLLDRAQPFSSAAAATEAGGGSSSSAGGGSGLWPEPATDVQPLADLAAGVAARGPAAVPREVSSVAVDARRGLVVAGGGDGVLSAWDLGGGGAHAPLPRLAGHAQAVLGVAVNAADGAVASASRDGTVAEWDFRAGTRTWNVGAADGTAISSGGAGSSAGGGSGGGSGGGGPAAHCVAYDNCRGGGSTLVVGSAAPSLVVFSRVAGKATSVVSAPAWPHALACLPDRFAVGGAEPVLRTYDFLGNPTSATKVSPGCSYALDADADAGLLLVAGSGGNADVVALGTDSKAGTIRGK